MPKIIRAALYVRVSTDHQTVENQERELQAAAAARGWEIVAVYADAGVSGAKGRDKRPQLDRMLKDAVRRRFDVVMAWGVDRLGRSLADLVAMLQDLHGAKIDLFLHTQGLDTTTPGGKAMFQMLGVFAEFERSMIQTRVIAGLDRARARGVKLGRKMIAPEIEERIRAQLALGHGMLKVAKTVGCGSGTVQRVKAAMQDAS